MAYKQAGVFEHHSLPGGVSLLVWNTRKFKTVSVKLFMRTDLLAETSYYVGVRAYYAGAQSVMSNTPDLTTLGSTPPVPAFTYDPPDVKNNDGSWTEYGSMVGLPIEK